MVREAGPRGGSKRVAAGFAGRGGSSYINSQIMRAGFDPDDWADPPPDGGFDTFHYLLQNFRGDVVVVVRDVGHLVEFIQYSANGVPFGIPPGNADSNGMNTGDDFTALIDWHAASVYDARWDINADGNTDFDDADYFPGVYMGRGVLSYVGNRSGYAGYMHAPELAGTKWHVRNRWLNSVKAMWLSMDPHPNPYIDGMNARQYVRGNPLVGVDPMGLCSFSTARQDNGSVALTAERAGYRLPGPLSPADRRCCIDASPNEAGIVCCRSRTGYRRVLCSGAEHLYHPLQSELASIIDDCQRAAQTVWLPHTTCDRCTEEACRAELTFDPNGRPDLERRLLCRELSQLLLCLHDQRHRRCGDDLRCHQNIIRIIRNICQVLSLCASEPSAPDIGQARHVCERYSVHHIVVSMPMSSSIASNGSSHTSQSME